MSIASFVLTGGPCAGKSTAEEMLRTKLTEYGVKPMFVRETAMDMLRSGVELNDMKRDAKTWKAFQRAVIEGQIDAYNRAIELAGLVSCDRVVILFDKGIRDALVALDESDYLDIVEGLTASVKVDATVDAKTLDWHMYQGVLHLVTAARGVPQHYNWANAARSEDARAAEAIDLKTLDAWTDHPGLAIINNTRRGEHGREDVSFEEKMHDVLAYICRTIGLPVPTGEEKEFMVSRIDASGIPKNAVRTAVSQVYLRSRGGVERRIRATELNGEVAFSYMERFTNYDMSRIRHSRVISEREFDTLLLDRNPDVEPLQKERISFLHQGQYCKLDLIASGKPRQVLEVEFTEDRGDFVPPDFISCS